MWHSLIGSGIITNDRKREIDTYLLIGSGTIFFLYNLFYIFWFLRMYTSTKKFHKYSITEAQNAAKKKLEFEKSNETTSRATAVAKQATLTGTGSQKSSLKVGATGDHSYHSPLKTGSVYFKKSSMSGSKKSNREEPQSSVEPIKAKNQSSINFTDLPKP